MPDNGMGLRIRQCMDDALGNRDQKPWSYRTLAPALHVSPGTIHGWVNGANVPDSKLERLSKIFRRPVAWLRYGESTPPLDEELLVGVLIAVLHVDEQERLALPPAKIARLAASFYDWFRNSRTEIDPSVVRRFTRLAAADDGVMRPKD